ncbi:uncharacterized protein BDZ99DRAFT_282269 [Mytilinidion resinicola]|uniref:Secreted protein n=1 Tax=Mytilinidion resinicola TaxID=574789 RepID=A0A6A6YSH7_9PEZI|nr:uncharacterized protein BDZ99DRAFT_282269 [Mytilinidion resinicola]KAF2811882.1 hypothetical protein BDZ99DRAFT_282269 [Mytilinidion resinicola]
MSPAMSTSACVASGDARRMLVCLHMLHLITAGLATGSRWYGRPNAFCPGPQAWHSGAKNEPWKPASRLRSMRAWTGLVVQPLKHRGRDLGMITRVRGASTSGCHPLLQPASRPQSGVVRMTSCDVESDRGSARRCTCNMKHQSLLCKNSSHTDVATKVTSA